MRNVSSALAILALVSACGGDAEKINTPTASADAPFRVGDKPSDVFRLASSGYTVTFEWRERSPVGLPGTWVLRQSNTTRRWDSIVGHGVPNGGYSTAWNYHAGEALKNTSTISCRWARDRSEARRLNVECYRSLFTSSLPDSVLMHSLYGVIEERLADREILGERVYCWAALFGATTCVTRDGIPLYLKSPINPGKRGTEWEELVATSIARIPPAMSTADELAARVANAKNLAAAEFELPEFGPHQ